MEVISSIYNSGYNIKKFYLGSRELNLAYLGNQVIYDEVIGDNDLNYILYEFYGSDTLPNTVEAPVKSAILKGSTKYRDIDTGDILDTFDETKNLELVSVKVPVLTTTGKNLINENTWNNVVTEDNNECLVGDGWATTGGPVGQPIIIPVAIKSGHTYTVSCTNKATSHFNKFFIVDDMIGNSVATVRTYIGENSTKGTFTTSELTFIADRDYKYLTIDTGEPSAMGYIVKNTLQVEVGNTHTPYEPYKSNILTTPKEVVLRSLPNGVCDTLNVETGEYIQRIGEVVFDGNANENWTLNTIHDINDTYAKFILRNVPNDMLLKNSLSHWIANRFKNQLRVSGVPNEEGISSEGSKQVPLMITIKRDKLTESTPEGFKRWLVQNPVTVQYELATPIIKTVVLSILDQSGNKVSSISSFNDTTHIMASSETIPPIFEGYLATKEVE